MYTATCIFTCSDVSQGLPAFFSTSPPPSFVVEIPTCLQRDTYMYIHTYSTSVSVSTSTHTYISRSSSRVLHTSSTFTYDILSTSAHKTHLSMNSCLSNVKASWIFSAWPLFWLYLNRDSSRTRTGGRWENHACIQRGGGASERRRGGKLEEEVQVRGGGGGGVSERRRGCK